MLFLITLLSCEPGNLQSAHKQSRVPSQVHRTAAVPEPIRRIEAPDPELDTRQFSSSFSVAGDVDGDGYADILIGDDASGENLTGAAYLYYGSASGLSGDYTRIVDSGVKRSDSYGKSLTGVGDLDEDGLDDFIISSHLNDDQSENSGCIYLYFGSITGNFTGEQLFAEDIGLAFGTSLSGVGDINDDGYPDLLVGAATNVETGGQAYLLYGSSSGFQDDQEIFSLSDGSNGESFGSRVSEGGDINADGIPDAFISAHREDDIGFIYVYYGSRSGLQDEQQIGASDAFEGLDFGWGISEAGDVDDDGYADIVVGAIGEESVTNNNGAIYVYYGSTSGIDPTSGRCRW
ncbi:MAG: hypothetical protein AAFV53_25545, partial [Myxococcota bacterium]